MISTLEKILYPSVVDLINPNTFCYLFYWVTKRWKSTLAGFESRICRAVTKHKTFFSTVPDLAIYFQEYSKISTQADMFEKTGDKKKWKEKVFLNNQL